MPLKTEVGLVLYIYYIGLDWTSFLYPSFFLFIGPMFISFRMALDFAVGAKQNS